MTTPKFTTDHGSNFRSLAVAIAALRSLFDRFLIRIGAVEDRVSALESSNHLVDAPQDGTTYGRNNGAWTAVSTASAGTTLGKVIALRNGIMRN